MPGFIVSRRTAAAVLLSSLITASCGFRLRGKFDVPFETIYLEMSNQSTLKHELQRRLNAETSATVVDDKRDAEAILSIVASKRSRVVNSYNDEGDAREYRIGMDITFKLTSPDLFEFLPPTKISARRDLPYATRNYLSREVEEATLYRDIEGDIIMQLMRRIEASRENAPKK